MLQKVLTSTLEQLFKMSFLRKILIILFISFFSANNLFADAPYFLDFKFILNESNAGKKAQNSLKSKLEKGIKSVKAKEKSIQDGECRMRGPFPTVK